MKQAPGLEFKEWLDESEQAAALVRHAAKRKTIIGALAGK